MAFDPYSSCPCGSGKKFKWCCQPIHQEMAKAFHLDEQGQHESALRVMDEVVAAHADNPEAWGKKALLLWQNEKPEEAEAALSKAFEVDPKYPFGHYLRARWGRCPGAAAGARVLVVAAVPGAAAVRTSTAAGSDRMGPAARYARPAGRWAAAALGCLQHWGPVSRAVRRSGFPASAADRWGWVATSGRRPAPGSRPATARRGLGFD